MAVISRRPRLAQIAVLALALIAAACSLIKPTETTQDKQEHAARLVHDGKHAEAAQLYADLSVQLPAESDNYQLLSAEQWVAAGNVAAAKQALAQVSPEARTKLATPRALVAAEIAYAENDPARAIRELDQIPVPTSPEQAQNYYWIRGRSAFLTGHPVEGVRALVERERHINDPAALRANRDELLSRVRTAAERGAPMKAPPKTDPVVLGWLELGPVAVEVERNPARAASALDAWKRQFPAHPANTSALSTAQTQIAVATEYPNQIALLLPLSGRAEAFGVAVRDGFIAAYLQQNAASRPQLKIYDVAAESVASAYNRAIADGAGFVVGPLFKDEVAAVAPVTGGRTPVLALNFLGETVAPPKNFYQFALLPEDEARMVARRMVADGRLNGVAIVPSGEWGTRVAAAFAEELKSLGGTVLDSSREHRRHRAPHPAAAEIQLFRRCARVLHLGQFRPGCQRQLGYRRHALPRHAVDDFQRPGDHADPRQRACSVAGSHRAARPPLRLRVRRVSAGARLADEHSRGFEQHRRRDRKTASRSAEQDSPRS